jgi:hypothetical protein
VRTQGFGQGLHRDERFVHRDLDRDYTGANGFVHRDLDRDYTGANGLYTGIWTGTTQGRTVCTQGFGQGLQRGERCLHSDMATSIAKSTQVLFVTNRALAYSPPSPLFHINTHTHTHIYIHTHTGFALWQVVTYYVAVQ